DSLFLTQQLNDLGVEVVRKLIVGDDRIRLAGTVRDCLSRAKIVIVTGGLGPTEDDVTRDAVAAALGRELIFSEELCAALEDRFRRANRKMAEINKRQAYLVSGAEVLPNPNGTAPGQWIERDGSVVMILPGPPRELKPLFRDQCASRLKSFLPPQSICTWTYRVAGLGESDLDQLIAPVYTQYQNPVTTILANAGDIQVLLRARGPSMEEAEALVRELGRKIEPLLGDRIYSRNGGTLEAVVGQLLRQSCRTLAVAESCTGGLLGERITRVPGSSTYFLGGFLTYSDRMKTELLGVDAELIERHTAVSEPVALAMAEGARLRTEADFGVSITGYAGPDGGTEENPVGTVFIGVASAHGSKVKRLRWPSADRALIRSYAAQIALDQLRRRLLD
ncbi:MAG TPA: competence/damage-inducible protein A, partial [Bryobacteraceae bacterium]|nr:competence/damage-inducible protein A [Bryobacteraceae bacterium]